MQHIKDQTIRDCGFSKKLRYIRIISQAVIDGELNFRELKTLDDYVVIDTLTRYPVISLWTMELFLISALARLDVLPIGDLMLRKSMQRHYKLNPDTEETCLTKTAETSRPYSHNFQSLPVVIKEHTNT